VPAQERATRVTGCKFEIHIDFQRSGSLGDRAMFRSESRPEIRGVHHVHFNSPARTGDEPRRPLNKGQIMRARIALLVLPVATALAGGCASVPETITTRAQAPGVELAEYRGDRSQAEKDKAESKSVEKQDGKNKDAGEKKENGDAEAEKGKPEKKEKKPPKALFEWAVGPEVAEKPEQEDRIITDRPDFTEASVTVGQGRVQLEAGYTYYRDRAAGATRVTQTYPEALLRVGVLSDWLELRLGSTYEHSRTTAFGQITEHLSGCDDLYLGTKVALTEQKAHLPETAIIFQATLPTAAGPLSAGKVLPGINLLFGWDVVPDFLTVGGSFQGNRVVDDTGHGYIEFAQSLTIGYQLTRQFGAFTEWFAFYPASAIAPDVTSQHYFNGGFSYLVTPDFQLDIRAGWGLNHHADDFFAGAGFAVRY